MAVFLRDPTDTSGKLKRFESEDEAEQAIADQGYEYASNEEVEARTLEREYGDRNASAFLRSAGAGVIDAAVSPVRLAGTVGAALTGQDNLDPFGEVLSGRKVMENFSAVASELAGNGNAEAAGREYAEESRAIAQANPNFTTAGYLGGQVLGGLGVAGGSSALGRAAASAATSSALGRSVLGMAVEGAAEGAILATGEAGEQAFIRNEKLTSEQILGSIGFGALIGGTVGGVAGGGIYGAGAVYRGGKRVVDGAGDKLRSVFGPRATASAETTAEVAEGALGVKVSKAEGAQIKDALEWARDKAEDAQVTMTGADPATLKKYGAGHWDTEAISGRQAYIDREPIREAAKRDLSKDLLDLTNAAEPVIDEVRYTGLKLEHIRANIGDNAAEQLAEAGRQADALEGMLTPMRKPGSASKATREAVKDAPIDREAYVQTFDDLERSRVDDEIGDEIREALEELGKDTAEGTRTWKRVEQNVLRDRVERQLRQAQPAPAVAPNEGRLRAELGSPGVVDEIDSYLSRNIAAIRKTDDPAVAYSLLDQTKRGLQKYAHSAGLSAEALVATSPERSLLARKRSDYLQRFQEPLRVSLENESIYGKAAVNQREVNAALTRFIEGNKIFKARYIRETSGYRGLDRTRAVRDEATSGFINKLGLAENGDAEAHLRAHLRSITDVVTTLDGALDIGTKKALVTQAVETAKRVNGNLDAFTKSVTAANRIEKLLHADSGGDGGVAKTMLGGIFGGPLGAAVGFAADVATSPGKQMRMAIGVQRVLQRNNVNIEAAVDRIFGKGVKAEAKAATEAAGTTGHLAGDAAVANDVGADVFKEETSEVRKKLGNAAKVAGVGALAVGVLDDDDEGAAAGALALPFMGKAGLRKAAQAVAGKVTPLGVAVPVALRTFMGDHEDKQAAFKARAKEIHAATADMGEGVRQVMSSEFGDIPADFPKLGAAMTTSLTRGALFLESKLPRSYRATAPGALGRSSNPVADHDIAKFARYWSAVDKPVSVLHDMALGVVTNEQIEAIKTVYPELWLDLSERLLERAAQADADGERLPMQTRMQIGRFVGVQIEPAFKSSVLDLIDQARAGRDQAQGQQPRPSHPPNLAAGIGPESLQLQQRAARM